MSNHYGDFLKRLVQYRIRLNMTQEKVSRTLEITQSQLSKQELGKTIVTYKSLATFMKMGWDVDYLLTGKRSVRKNSELTDLLKGTDQRNGRSMLEFITWALGMGMERSASGLSVEEKCEICILKMKSSSEDCGSLMYEIRKISGESQAGMAEKLGVNIKKYRALEKAQINPDAELLLDIYETTGCKPSLFLITEDIENAIIDDLWSRITTAKRQEILSIVLQVDKFLRT